jgi:tRNA threonylcarbamoyladenosine biosynthesis protein TsaE
VAVSGAPLVAHTDSAPSTRHLAAALAPVLHAGDLLLLAGDLGAGKTTFVQGLARGLGVTEPVTSPTFTLVRAYACRRGPVATLLHADLYRLDRLSDVVDLGLAEMVEDEAVGVVEWGDVARSLFGPDVLAVALSVGATGDERVVTLDPGGAWAPRRSVLARVLDPWTRVGTDAAGRGAAP